MKKKTLLSKKNITKRIRNELAFVATQQNANGYFESVRYTLNKESCYETVHTTYYTSSILCMLFTQQQETYAQKIIKNAIHFLTHENLHKSQWNYYAKCSKYFGTVPDDLDDTSLALAALRLYTHTSHTVEKLYTAIHTLIDNEMKPGGPYYTWLVEKKLRTTWINSDIVVNAHIHYFLSLHDINSKPLIEWIDAHIQEADLRSEFYLSPITILYCITRASTGIRNKKILQLLRRYQSRIHNPLLRAHYVTAYLRAGGNPRHIKTHILQLLALPKTKRRKPYPVFIEKQTKNTIYFSGCTAYTSTAYIEALSQYEYYNLKKQKTDTVKRYHAQIIHNISKYIPVHFQKSLIPHIQKFLSSEPKQKNILPTGILNDIVKTKTPIFIPQRITETLTIAHILGWTGYTLLDDWYDNEQSSTDIPSIHYAISHTRALLLSCAPHQEAVEYIEKTLLNIHAKLEKERTLRRYQIQNNQLQISDLQPIVVHHTSLYKKSFGHALSTLMILLHAGYSIHSPEFRACELFFRHYLTAQQLHDDAHDVFIDLQRGHISSTVALLLNLYKNEYPKNTTIHLVDDMHILKQLFWTKCINTISFNIASACKNARRYLGMTPFKNKSNFISLIKSLEDAAQQACLERDMVTRFLTLHTTGLPK